ncbi:SIMPL domain-containing protein [Aquimarina megaterium]|uniref:SIMPL domain-containing protein n=1 Tax=Aquimarina megaterium TaxID=1443666 RepID=UPI000942F20D|nr:SIMPL domain-containing protein [Aquimarina megaterium]
MKTNISSVLFSLAIVISSIVLGNAYMNRNKPERTIAVTGHGTTNFTSDLIVWEGQFIKANTDLQQAYNDLKEDKKTVADYLSANGIDITTVVFDAVTTDRITKSNYSSTGNYLGESYTGYQLSQTIKINSSEIEKVEKISREITILLNKGVQFSSKKPRYYYTKLAELKIEMISKATENAQLRAEKIAKNSGSTLGELTLAKMGIFQITGKYSGEDHSWGGALNTSSREKTASITTKLIYTLK